MLNAKSHLAMPTGPTIERTNTRLAAGDIKPGRVLVSTIQPKEGGVPVMTRFVLDCLVRAGMEPVIAYYKPYSVAPTLSVPIFQLLRRRVGEVNELAFDGVESHGIGAWFPELEFTHYLPTCRWRRLMETCTYHIAVSGNALATLPYAVTRRPFLGWIATPWHDDREQRVKHFPFARRALDRLVNGPVIRFLERQAVRRGTILALSEYTQKKLNLVSAGTRVFGVMGHPVDTEKFSPEPESVVCGRIGFVGRFDDPRKNAALLVDAIQICRQNGIDITGILIGGQPDRALADRMKRSGTVDQIQTLAYVNNEDLPAILQTLDIFVIPSHQEGLCIAALEAMACGVPVVSTRCGGPEEYVLNEVTGYLVKDNPTELADRVTQIYTDRILRDRLGKGARRTIEKRYNNAVSEARFWDAFTCTFQA